MMTDEELIRQLRKVGTTNGHDNSVVLRAADRLEALTATPPICGGAAVKPLGWWTRGNGDIVADSLAGWYVLHAVVASTRFRLEGPEGFIDYQRQHEYWPLDEAKAAAQADYERRILSALSPAPVGVTDDDPDEAYELGKRDGYDEAVADIDRLTGGDGEYRFCTDHDPDRHTPDPETMKQRIADRFDALASHEPAPEPAKDGPEVVGWRSRGPKGGWIYRDEPYDNGCEPLVRLSDYEALRVENERIISEGTSLMREADACIAELVKALKPFTQTALVSDQYPDDYEVDLTINVHGEPYEDQLTLEDFRRARAALKGQSNEA